MSNGRLHKLLDFSAKTSGKPEMPQINPRRFNDPIAMECGWEQLDYSNKNFETHVLTKSGDNHLVYRPNTSIKVIGAFFLLVGAALSVSYMTRVIDSLTALFSGSIFLLAGIYITIRNLKPEGFDGNRRIFHRGYSFQTDSNRVRGSRTVPFEQIHAVQLLTKVGALKVGSDIYMADEYFSAYELNLVTDQAARTFVMTYTDRETATRDAEQIARLVEVPLWAA